MVIVRCLITPGVIAACAAFAPRLPAQPPPVDIHRVVSIDPDATGDADLLALAADIADARIVLLGEQTHGSGSAFLAKTRVVKFLHRRLGFDVLAFEGGLCQMAGARDRAAAGESPGAVVPLALPAVWAKSVQMQPLFTYLDEAVRAGMPLALAGIDLYFSGPLQQRLPADLRALNGRLRGDRVALERIVEWIERYLRHGDAGLEDLDIDRLRTDVAGTAVRITRFGEPRERLWAQCLQNVERLLAYRAQPRAEREDMFNMRDLQMAGNVSWLADEGYAGRKLMVWAASAHLLTHAEALQGGADRGRVPMGVHIRRRWGETAYTLAVTAYQGSISSLPGGRAYRRPPAVPGSLEEEINRCGFDYAYIGRAGMQRRFARPCTAQIVGFALQEALWSEAVDGVLFIRTMAPSTYLE